MFIEAVVTSIDMEKGICRCKNIVTGHTLENVKWLTPLGESPVAPEHGEQVFIAQTQRGLWIIGGMTLTASDKGSTPSMLDGLFDGTVQRGITAQAVGYGNITNARDQIPGDGIINAKGGSVIGALTGGLAIFKASSVAQILATKIGGFIKVFALNFQRFTDAASHEELNVEGKTFVREEFYNSQTNSRGDSPKYARVIGDCKEGYDGDTEVDVVKLEVVQPSRGETPFLLEESYLDGKKIEITQTASAQQKTRLTRKNNEWKLEVIGSGASSVLTLKNDGTVTLVSSSSLTVTTPQSTFNGNVRVNGNVNVSSNVILDSGITLGTHKHPGTGGPIP